MSDLLEQFRQLGETNVTKTVHQKPYPALSFMRPEMSQAGRVVLIPGGGANIGHSIARSFIRASADTVIIIGRRAEVLRSAGSRLEEEAKLAGTGTKIITRSFDVVNIAEVEAFWRDLADQGITVDVLVANVAKSPEPKSIIELGADEVWSFMEINVRSPLYFAEKFFSQPGGTGKQKFIINVSTAAVHSTSNPGVAVRPAYTFSKLSGTLLWQVIAQNVSPEKVQIISFHPGNIYNQSWEKIGVPKELFDTDELCGAFAVWLATKEAQFLHGRFVWAAWDVEELSTGSLRKRIDEDPYFLKASIVGLSGGLLA